MIRSIQIALWSYVAPVISARAVRISLIASVALLATVVAGVFLGRVPESLLVDLRGFVIIPGLAVAAALLSEVAIRDGITHRTLLYPLLGPVSRPVLVIVRTTATAILIAVGIAVLVLVLGALAGSSQPLLLREAGAILLGSLAYTALFSVVHLLTRRGLIVCLAIYAIHDAFIGRVPFSIRNTAPSHHVRVLADLEDTLFLPIQIVDLPTSVAGSAMFLIFVYLACVAIGSWLFSRKNLGELC